MIGSGNCGNHYILSSKFKSFYLFIFAGDELRWTFTADSSVNGWGWRFTVYPVMSGQGLNELGSDRAILSQPSMDMVMSLLDPRLYSSATPVLMSRLAASLAACSQLNFLCKCLML